MDCDAIMECPYDKNHQVRHSRFPYHLVKCREHHKDKAKELATCPFNARHRVPKRELKYHLESCTDKNVEDLIDEYEHSVQVTPFVFGTNMENRNFLQTAEDQSDVMSAPSWEPEYICEKKGYDHLARNAQIAFGGNRNGRILVQKSGDQPDTINAVGIAASRQTTVPHGKKVISHPAKVAPVALDNGWTHSVCLEYFHASFGSRTAGQPPVSATHLLSEDQLLDVMPKF
ncbi:uncharacterized protein LOC122810625 [Protopterus annectens]|uniref:uncharacterized protein LOC122810625 n=1 Tax=Protopterus annectens TaxID=7888 RepID=UPI001CF9927A|nr:uncharacterized protein LOC122810625 [Protopterus annectens]